MCVCVLHEIVVLVTKQMGGHNEEEEARTPALLHVCTYIYYNYYSYNNNVMACNCAHMKHMQRVV